MAWVFLGSAAWWLVLSVGSRRLGARLGAREMAWLNRLSGVVILGFGFWNLSKLAFQLHCASRESFPEA